MRQTSVRVKFKQTPGLWFAVWGLIVSGGALPGCGGTAAPPGTAVGMLEVKHITLEPVAQGKNVVRIRLRNVGDQPRVFAIHIFTRSPNSAGPTGWGAPFFETIQPARVASPSFAYKIQGPITDRTEVVLSLHDLGSEREYDSDHPFLVKKYRGRALQRRAMPQGNPASQEKTRAAVQALERLQQAVRDDRLADAWQAFSKGYQQAEWQGRFDKFEDAMAGTLFSHFVWEKDALLTLKPTECVLTGKLIRLIGRTGDEDWRLDFIEAGAGALQLDWIAGYLPRLARWKNWEKYLLPRMRKRSSKHFDVYCFPGTAAAKDLDRIVEAREKACSRIAEFLGTRPAGRITLVLFEDKDTKFKHTGHQGMGWATGQMMVEVYNSQGRVDPCHETTHVVAAQIGNPPALLNEGLAVYMQDGHKWKGEHVDVTASRLLERRKLTPLTQLITRNEIGSRRDDGRVAYPQSGSFVKFIIERYGRDQFLKLYGKLKVGAEDNSSRFEQVLDVPLETAEKQWQAFLRSIRH